MPLVSGLECPFYNCTATSTTSDTCVSYQSDSNTFLITPCAGDTICPTDFSESDKTCTSSSSLRYPGDYCAYDQECRTKSCKNNKCVGHKSGEACQYVYDCEQGLYCDPVSSICTSQVKQQEDCLDSYSCLNSLVCNLGKCVPYFSVDVGQVTDDVNAVGFSWACETGYAEENESGDFVCKTGPKSADSLPVKCLPGDKCKSTDDNFSLDCVCGLNNEAQGYCPLFPGDEPVSQLISYVRYLVEYNYQCNSYSRFDYSCFMNGSKDTVLNYYKFGMLEYQVIQGMYPYTQDNPACVQKTYTKTYYDLKKAAEDTDQISCPRYVCTHDDSDWQQNQCILYDKEITHFIEEEELYIKMCPDTFICPSNRLLNATCIEERPSKYPGDYCNHNKNCTSYVCTEDRCGGGKGINEYCSNMYECMSGMYCDVESLSCQETKTIDQICYTSYACDSMLTCNLGKCVRMYSLEIGSKTDVVKGYGYAEACESGFAQSDDSGEFVCANPPKSPEGGPFECDPGSLCYSDDGQHSRPCTCGYNEDGIAYCPEFEGDTHLQKAITLFRSLPFAHTVCNSFSRNSVECLIGSGNKNHMDTYFEYMTNKTMYQYFPYLQNNSDCVKEVYTSYFWGLKIEWKDADEDDKDEKDDFASRIVAAVGLLVGLLI